MSRARAFFDYSTLQLDCYPFKTSRHFQISSACRGQAIVALMLPMALFSWQPPFSERATITVWDDHRYSLKSMSSETWTVSSCSNNHSQLEIFIVNRSCSIFQTCGELFGITWPGTCVCTCSTNGSHSVSSSAMRACKTSIQLFVYIPSIHAHLAVC